MKYVRSIAALKNLRDTPIETVNTTVNIDYTALINNGVSDFILFLNILLRTNSNILADGNNQFYLNTNISRNAVPNANSFNSNELNEWMNVICDNVTTKVEQMCNQRSVSITKSLEGSARC